MKIYINGYSSISAQHVFSPPTDLSVPASYSRDRLSCLEPDYDKILEPTQIRRLSRLLKMGTATSAEAIKQVNNQKVDAVITGTGYGYLEDTARFLFKMTDPGDRGMNPTSFIQSTYNTIGALIALNLKNNGYNNTFVHSGFSFESALDDAILLIKSGDANSVLVGGLDELTDEVYDLLIRLQAARKRITRKKLSRQPSDPYPFGEGSSFFVLSNKPDSPFPAEITSYTTLYNPDKDQIISAFEEIVRNDKVEHFLLGKNADEINDESYDWISSKIPVQKCFSYKSLCGEYPTAFSFGLWLAVYLLSGNGNQLIPVGKNDSILIYNCFEKKYHAFLSIRRGW